MFELQHLDHVAITVSDLERSKRWYCDVLGMEHRFPGLWDGVPIMLALGNTLIALFPAAEEASPDAPQRAIRVAHIAFRADRQNFEAARRDLATKSLPSPSRITTSATLFTSPTPTAISWRSPPTSWSDDAAGLPADKADSDQICNLAGLFSI